MLQDNGRIRYSSPADLRRALKLPLDTRLALIGATVDHVIEQFWKTSETQKAWQIIAGLDFEFATSMTFSVWNKQPRFDQIYNRDRNFFTHDRLLEVGVNSIPFLFFYSEKDYQEVVMWLQARPDVQKVAVLAQFYETMPKIEQLISDMKNIKADLGRDLQFLVVGVSSAEKIAAILSAFNDATIVTLQPIYKALMWQQTLPDLKHTKVHGIVSQAKLAARNVELFQKYCSEPRLWRHAA